MYRCYFLLMALAMLCSCNNPTVNSKVLMFIGTSSNDSLKGIEYCYLDTVTGVISQPVLTGKMLNPGFLEIDVENQFLFAIGKKDQVGDYIVRSYRVDAANGHIAQVSEVQVPGEDPCYVALDSSGKQLMVANYSSGNVSSFRNTAGELSYLNTIKHYGSGPDLNRQKAPYAHSIDIDPGSDLIYSADLGADKLMVYRMTESGLTTIDSVMCKPGAGPRHFDFSPDGKILAVVNELNCSVSTFEKDANGIYKEEVQTLSLLPDTFSAFAGAADIHFTKDGKFLYASNRGFDCIGIFKVNGKQLEFVEFVTEGILWPRNFAIDPSGNFLLVANRDLNNISVYKRNKETGRLTMLPDVASIERPFCIKFYN